MVLFWVYLFPSSKGMVWICTNKHHIFCILCQLERPKLQGLCLKFPDNCSEDINAEKMHDMLNILNELLIKHSKVELLRLPVKRVVFWLTKIVFIDWNAYYWSHIARWRGKTSYMQSDVWESAEGIDEYIGGSGTQLLEMHIPLTAYSIINLNIPMWYSYICFIIFYFQILFWKGFTFGDGQRFLSSATIPHYSMLCPSL